MDISVSHLNRRMALQVPPELPLGLVLVAGAVHNLDLQQASASQRIIPLQLRDGDHFLDCQLPRQLLEETLLRDGDHVRLGGQLAFDALSARYQLRVHHLEVLASPHADMAPANVRAAVAGRSAQQATLAPPDLPRWVRQLAPPEIQRELGFDVEDDGTTEEPAVHEQQQSAPWPPASQTADPTPSATAGSDLPPEMVRFLSEAIDDDADVELTPQLLSNYGLAAKGAMVGHGLEGAPGQTRARRKGVAGNGPERRARQTPTNGIADLADSIAAWLANPQLYIIPLIMFLIFLTAVFIFFLIQQ